MQPPRRLRIYPDALRLLALLDEVAVALPPMRDYMAGQLRRAALSIALNLEEGAYEFSPKDKTRFYRMSYRSLAECRALLDVIDLLKLVEKPLTSEARRSLEASSPRIYNLIRRRAPTTLQTTRPPEGLPAQPTPRQATPRAKRAPPS